MSSGWRWSMCPATSHHQGTPTVTERVFFTWFFFFFFYHDFGTENSYLLLTDICMLIQPPLTELERWKTMSHTHTSSSWSRCDPGTWKTELQQQSLESLCTRNLEKRSPATDPGITVHQNYERQSSSSRYWSQSAPRTWKTKPQQQILESLENKSSESNPWSEWKIEARNLKR